MTQRARQARRRQRAGRQGWAEQWLHRLLVEVGVLWRPPQCGWLLRAASLAQARQRALAFCASSPQQPQPQPQPRALVVHVLWGAWLGVLFTR